MLCGMSESKVLGWFVAVPIMLLCTAYGVFGVLCTPWLIKPISALTVVVGTALVCLVVRDLRSMKA